MEHQVPGPPPPPTPSNPYAPPPPGDPRGYGPPPGGSTGGPRLPWEERSRLGFLPALIETTKLLITDPAEAFGRLRADEDLVSPLLFGGLLGWIGLFFSLLWNMVMGGAMMSLLPSDEALQGMAVMAGSGLVQMIVWMVLWPIIYLLSTFILAGLYHLGLMAVGALNGSPMRFEGTLKVVAYAQVVNLASIVPIVGGLAAFVWMIFLLVIGFAAVHATTHGKAFLGWLVPVAVCCVCGGILLAIFGAAIAAAIAGAANSGWLAF